MSITTEKLQYIFEGKGDLSSLDRDLNNTKKILDKLKLPDAISKNFSKEFDKAATSITKIQTALSKENLSVKEVGQLKKEYTNLDNILRTIQVTIGKISDTEIIDSLDIDLKPIQELRNRLVEIDKELQAGRQNAKGYFDEFVNSRTDKKLPATMQKLQEFMSDTSKSAEEMHAKLEKVFSDKNGIFSVNGKQLTNPELIDAYKKLAANLTTYANNIKQVKAQEEALQEERKQAKATEEAYLQSQKDLATQGFDKTRESIDPARESVKRFVEAEVDAREQAANTQTEIDNLYDKFKRFFSLTSGIQLFRRAVRDAINTVKELDAVMTETAVVTDFSVSDMWDQLPEYTKRANELGVSIHDVYEAATLYYQQGLSTNEVMSVTNATLKMARIASLDAAEATDRMTNAMRGFNMEINETNADRIADVYSKLAAITASDVDEISTAMTKVASLAKNANMQFENTAAFLAQIIETTRESAETAGTALKTVVARFSEVKELYSKDELLGTDEEGEEIDVNKVSQALRSAGIDLNEYLVGKVGLDEIFIELAEKWKDLDLVQQRYIATQAAGSRQQSRFIALMQNYDRTMKLTSAAYHAQGASQEQYAKTLDSLKSKLAQLKNSWDTFVLTLADSDIIKGAVDLFRSLLDTINNISNAFGKLSGVFKVALTAGIFKLGSGIAPALKKGLGKTIADVTGNAIQEGVKDSTKLSKSGRLSSIGNAIWAPVKSTGGGTSLFNGMFAGLKLKKQSEIVNKLKLDNAAYDVASQHAQNLYNNIAAKKGEFEAAIDPRVIDANARTIKPTGDLNAELEKQTLLAKKQQQWMDSVPKAATVLGAAYIAVGTALGGLNDKLKENAKLADEAGDYEKADQLEKRAEAIEHISKALSITGTGLITLGQLIPVLKASSIGAIKDIGASIATFLPWLAIIGVAIGGVVALVDSLTESAKEKTERLQKEAERAQQEAEKAQSIANDYNHSYERLVELDQKLKDGNTALEDKNALFKEQQELIQELINKYPELEDKYFKYGLGGNGLGYQLVGGNLTNIQDDLNRQAMYAQNTSIGANLAIKQNEYNNRTFEAPILSEHDQQILQEVYEEAFNNAIDKGKTEEEAIVEADKVKTEKRAQLSKKPGAMSPSSKTKLETDTASAFLQAYSNIIATNKYNTEDDKYLADFFAAKVAEANKGLVIDTEEEFTSSLEEIDFTDTSHMEAWLQANGHFDEYQDYLAKIQKTTDEIKNNGNRELATQAAQLGTKASDAIKNGSTLSFTEEEKRALIDSLGIATEEAFRYNIANGTWDFTGDYQHLASGLSHSSINRSNIEDREYNTALQMNGNELRNSGYSQQVIQDALNTQLAAEGLQDSVQTFIDSTKDELKASDELLKALYLDTDALNKKIDNFNESLEESFETVKSVINGESVDTEDYTKALTKIQKTSKDLFGLEFDQEFIQKHLNDFEALLGDDATAAQEAFTNIGKDSAIAIGLGFAENWGLTEDEIRTLVDYLDGTEFGINGVANLDAIFNELIAVQRAAEVTESEIESSMQSMANALGIQLEFKYDKIKMVDWNAYHTAVRNTIDELGLSQSEARAYLEPENYMREMYAISGISASRSNYSGSKAPSSPSGGSSKGSSGSSKSAIWKNPYLESYNTEQSISESQRQLNEAQAEYNKLLRSTTTTAKGLLKNNQDRVKLIQNELELQTKLRNQYLNELKSAGSETYNNNGKLVTYSSMGVERYARYNQESRKIEIDYAALEQVEKSGNEELGQAIESWISLLQTREQNVESINTKIDSLNDNLIEALEEGKEEYLDLEQQVYDALVEEQQKVIDGYSAFNDSINNSNADILNSLQQQIDLERQIRDNTQTEQDIADKQRRLAYLQRDTSGANQSEILKLQKEIDKSQQSYQDQLVDQAIQKIGDDNQQAADQRQKQIDLMQTQLDLLSEGGYFWDEAHRIMDEEIENLLSGRQLDESGKLYKLLYGTDTVWGMSAQQTAKWQEELENMATQASLWYKNQNQAEKTVEANKTGTYSNPNQNTNSTATSGQAPSKTSSSASGSYTVKKGDSLWGIAQQVYGNGARYKDLMSINGLVGTEIYPGQVLRYKTGGIADYTGPAWLDGSKSHPELVLNARDTENYIKLTKVLSSIGSGKISSLGTTYANVEINVDSIGSDYDVDRLYNRVKEDIYRDASYRNGNIISFQH